VLLVLTLAGCAGAGPRTGPNEEAPVVEDESVRVAPRDTETAGGPGAEPKPAGDPPESPAEGEPAGPVVEDGQGEENDGPPGRYESACAERAELDDMLSQVRQQVGWAPCALAVWFDGFFGDERIFDEPAGSHGRLGLGTRWDERDGWDPFVRLRAQFVLPKFSKRFDGFAFIARGDEQQIVEERQQGFEALPSRFESTEAEDWLAGLGVTRARTPNQMLDFSVGVKIRWPLDPYAKVDWRWLRPLGRDTLFRFKETVFWRRSEQFGSTTRLDLDHVLNDSTLARWTTSGTVSGETSGVAWASQLIFYHVLSDDDSIAWRTGVFGETGRGVPIRDYGAELTYRRRFMREWLFFELGTSLSFPRDMPEESREPNWGVSFGIEMAFGSRAAEGEMEEKRFGEFQW
jgi:hypothetical protein